MQHRFARPMAVLALVCAASFGAAAQPAAPTPGPFTSTITFCWNGVTGAGSEIVACEPAGAGKPITYQGNITLAAATSTGLIAANVTMSPNSAALPAPGAFKLVTFIIPAACAVTPNYFGGTATATSGTPMGSGTNVGFDTVNLTGVAAAPTLFSTAGCTNISFRG